VIYEAHVRWPATRHPDIPQRLRGTFAELANYRGDDTIAYLDPHIAVSSQPSAFGPGDVVPVTARSPIVPQRVE
jgi:hypothetical protein